MSVIASVVQKGSYEIYVLEILLIFAEVRDLKFQIQLVWTNEKRIVWAPKI